MFYDFEYTINGVGKYYFHTLPEVYKNILIDYSRTHSDYLIQHCNPDFHTYHITDSVKKFIADCALHSDEIRTELSDMIMSKMAAEIQSVCTRLSKELNRKIELFDARFSGNLVACVGYTPKSGFHVWSDFFGSKCYSVHGFLKQKPQPEPYCYLISIMELTNLFGKLQQFQFGFTVDNIDEMFDSSNTINPFHRKKQEAHDFLNLISNKIKVALFHALKSYDWKLFDFTADESHLLLRMSKFATMNSTDMCDCAKSLLDIYRDDSKQLNIISKMFMTIAEKMQYESVVAIILDRMHKYCHASNNDMEMEL